MKKDQLRDLTFKLDGIACQLMNFGYDKLADDIMRATRFLVSSERGTVMFKLADSQFDTFPICGCGQILTDPEEGVIVQGNIHVASVDGGGLVGGSFPKEPFNAIDLQVTVFCKGCFLSLLGWD